MKIKLDRDFDPEDPGCVACAAIVDGDFVYYLPRPARHHDVINYMVETYHLPIPIEGEQGFILTDSTFVGRAVAKMIADSSKQILEGSLEHPLLFSENVW